METQTLETRLSVLSNTALVSLHNQVVEKPVVKFKGAEKKLALNKTNAKAIIALYGPNTEDWPGKKVVLFKSRTQMGGEEVDCIRIKAAK